jgi:hypothetical protein
MSYNQFHKDFDRFAYCLTHDTERIRITEKGDKYILLGTQIGMIVGGIAGGIIGYCVNLNVSPFVLVVLGGVWVGALIAAITSFFIQRHIFKKAIENMQLLKKIDEL